eukprot:CAMPEP_0119039022 /NCGR_PEP_ID=MMETSP1177-20130426/8296_1 /TAXON_ID=2985 /ORGANISM="Ochromonas sp, Strain CCMP1899" /LENGTH=324 /DNA_ID=CAMNT_0007002383 /DNA_START=47 /DNA_END=1018 /DNA_ORIENTATION=+
MFIGNEELISSQEQERRDREIAMQLQYGRTTEESKQQISMAERFRGGFNAMEIFTPRQQSTVETTPTLVQQEQRDREIATQLQYGRTEESPPQISMAERLRGGFSAMGNIWITNIPSRQQSTVETTPTLVEQYSNMFTSSQVKNVNSSTNDTRSANSAGIEGGTFRTETPMTSNRTATDDNILARALQAMEFEIPGETLERREARERETSLERGDFSQKELSASSCKGQVLTLSTLICLMQIVYLIAMIQQDGYASSAVNPMIGPPATTLIRYGGKYAGLIVYENQWWRLISPIAVHAGIIHLIANVVIQLRVGGYLNLVYGAW